MMDAYNYFDVHTHQRFASQNTLSIYVPSYGEDISQLPSNKPFSLGLHPWDTHQIELKLWQKQYEQFYSLDNCWAVGEIGLDLYKNLKFTNHQYLEYFFSVAKELNRPIVLHIVKTYPELLTFIKNNVNYHFHPKIFHAYHANYEVTLELINFNSYFSLGPRELKRNVSNKNLKSRIFERLLLETDDSNLSIDHSYQLASTFFDVSLKQTAEQVQRNFKTLFFKQSETF